MFNIKESPAVVDSDSVVEKPPESKPIINQVEAAFRLENLDEAVTEVMRILLAIDAQLSDRTPKLMNNNFELQKDRRDIKQFLGKRYGKTTETAIFYLSDEKVSTIIIEKMPNHEIVISLSRHSEDQVRERWKQMLGGQTAIRFKITQKP